MSKPTAGITGSVGREVDIHAIVTVAVPQSDAKAHATEQRLLPTSDAGK
jgi:hypothetical protein